MKIIVGIKHVPDTETKIQIAADGRSLDGSAVSKWIISPFDEYAVEQALQVRDAHEGSEVVLLCVGPDTAQATLRQGLAMGADRAVLVADERLAAAGPLTRAKAMAAVIQSEQAELVFLGKYGVGTDEGLTGPMLAELLGWPHATAVSKFKLADGALTVEREVEGAVEVQEGRLPALISCDKGLNEPRYPSLKGIMQAKKKSLETKSAADVGVDEAELARGPGVVWESMELPEPRETGRILDGGPEDAARELARILHEERKVI